MPGFNVGALGGGYSTQGPSNITETRRRYRWVMETLGKGSGFFTQTELLLLQSAARPQIKFEEPEMHHNQEVTRFAGKQDWEPITLTWYDAEQSPDISRSLYAWIETVVNVRSMQVSHPANYKKTGSLAMLSGMGTVTERWALYGVWPTSCNWGELDYTATDLATLEATIRFDRAVRDCTAIPGPEATIPSCP
jgi:hypothetical protein